MARVYREYERRKAERGEIDFEDLLELAVRLFEGDEQVRADVPRPLPRVHGRRVPGREPAPADAARALARRPRRPLRRRRRLPVDLRASPAPRRAGCSASPARFPHADGRAARGELPLDARGARAREPARAAARRRREGAARHAPRRAASRSLRGVRDRRGGGRVARGEVTRLAARGHCRSRRSRVLVPDERAPGRLRGGAPRGGDPVPGLVAARARGRAPAAASCSTRDSSTGVAEPRPRARRGGRDALRAPRQARRARADAAGRPRPARPPRRGARRRRADVRRRSPPSSAAASIPGGEGARGVHLLTYHRAKGLEFEAVFLPRLDEKELPSRLARTRRGARRGAAALLRRDHARASGTSRSRGRAEPSPFLARARRRDAARPAGEGAVRRLRIRCSTARSRPGARSGRRQRRCRRTSSSTTRRSRRSPARSRARSTSSPAFPASGPRSSTVTATRCSRSSRQASVRRPRDMRWVCCGGPPS